MSAILSGVLSGVLLVVCFPRFDFHLAAWVALVPLLHHVSRSGFRQAVAGGAAMGVVFHLANLYWIANVMVRYGGLDRPVGFAVLLALVGYLTLFTAAFGGLTAAACRLGGFRALFVTPVFWVGLELLRNYPFGGFPWCLLGYSQVSVLPILQLASITGIHGISFLLVLVNALIAYWLTGPGKKSILLSAAPVGAALAGVLAYGHAELSRPLPATSLRVAAVQGNVLQEQKWDPGYAARISADHLMLSVEAAGQGARLIAWPESSTPFHFDSTPALANRIRTFVREKEVYLLFGSDDYEFPSSDGTGDYRAFNGAKLLTPEGRVSLRYHKMHLVPFGEYVPLRSVFSFAGRVVESVSDFSAGTEVAVAPVDGTEVGAFICYEAIYPDLVRRFVVEGADLLVNLTNDAWFGRSAAPYQHFHMAVARAVENRRYLLRAANTGISALVDPYGRVVKQSELFTPQVIYGEVTSMRETTPFTRHGSLLARSSAVVTCFFGAVVAVLHFGASRRRS